MDSFDTIIKYPSPNFNHRPDERIDALVFHYTDLKSSADSLARLTDPKAEVSAHYLIDEQGQVYQLVADEYRAWHAGTSYWRGQEGLNATSIGIELQNTGHQHGYENFPNAQVLSLIALSRMLIQKYDIPAPNIVGHSDIAPVRKQDPGEKFPWAQLAAAGVGLFPEAKTPPAGFTVSQVGACQALQAIGYKLPDQADTVLLRQVITAFQRRFLPLYFLDPSLQTKVGELDRTTAHRMQEVRALFS